MKRFIALLLVLVLGLPAFGGCGFPKDDKKNNDPNTLTLTMATGRNENVIAAMIEKFPEINFDINYYAGGNTSTYLGEEITHGDTGDLIFYTVFTALEEQTKNLLDLSGYNFLGNLKPEILNSLDVDGAIYQVPGPLEVRCMAYNKTMFREKGWDVPKNFDEQIALIEKIRMENPEITPIVSPMSAAFSFLVPTVYAQAGYLSSPEGYRWSQDFFSGNASFGTGMNEGFTAVERLIDAGAFAPDQYANSTDCDAALIDHTAAFQMIWSGIAALDDAAKAANSTDEFGLIPFYGIHEGTSTIGYSPSSLWSLGAHLGEKGNEKKLENGLKVMAWLASAEGQALLRANSGQLPVTKEGFDVDPRVDEMMSFGANGFKALGLYAGYEHLIVEAGTVIQNAIASGSSEGMRENATQIADNLNKEYLLTKDTAGYAHLAEDINEAETTQLVADILFNTGLGDFALSTHTGGKNGVINANGTAGKLYAGGIKTSSMLIINANRRMLVTTIDLTGAEIRTLLEQGKGLYEDEWKVYKGTAEMAKDPSSLPQEYFEYYWSGIDVTMKKGKVTSIKLNGTELSNTETYTVVFAQYDYPREFMDKAVVTKMLVSDAMIAYCEKNPEIAKPNVLRK